MEWKSMIRDADLAQLEANWNTQLKLKGTDKEKDFSPVCRLYDPFGASEWYITEVDDSGLAFGLAFIFEYEIGYFDLGELFDLKIAGQPRIVQDTNFTTEMTLSQLRAFFKAM